MYGVACRKPCYVQLTLTLPHRGFAGAWLYIRRMLSIEYLFVSWHTPATLFSSGRTAIHFTGPVSCWTPLSGSGHTSLEEGYLRGHVGTSRNGIEWPGSHPTAFQSSSRFCGKARKMYLAVEKIKPNPGPQCRGWVACRLHLLSVTKC